MEPYLTATFSADAYFLLPDFKLFGTINRPFPNGLIYLSKCVCVPPAEYNFITQYNFIFSFVFS